MLLYQISTLPFTKLFSAPEPKAQVHYCDNTLSVVRRRLLFTFSTSPLKPLNGIQRNLTGSKISTSSTMFVFFGPIRKTRWPPWPLIGWDIFRLLLWNCWREFNETWQEMSSSIFSWKSVQLFLFSAPEPKAQVHYCDHALSVVRPSSLTFHIFDFSSEAAKRNSMKLDRKQELNVLYQVCVFRADRKNKMAALASDWLRHFRLLLWNRWTEFYETSQEARSQRPLPSCVFRAYRKNKMVALASDWLRHFRLLLWNRLTEFNETWQEARSQRPLPSLCFSSRSEKTRWLPLPLIR